MRMAPTLPLIFLRRLVSFRLFFKDVYPFPSAAVAALPSAHLR